MINALDSRLSFSHNKVTQSCRGEIRGVLLINQYAKERPETCLTEEEKSQLSKKIKTVLVQPKFMILWNYEAYYDISTRSMFAEEFIDLCNELGYKYYAEGGSIADLKTKYGI